MDENGNGPTPSTALDKNPHIKDVPRSTAHQLENASEEGSDRIVVTLDMHDTNSEHELRNQLESLQVPDDGARGEAQIPLRQEKDDETIACTISNGTDTRDTQNNVARDERVVHCRHIETKKGCLMIPAGPLPLELAPPERYDNDEDDEEEMKSPWGFNREYYLDCSDQLTSVEISSSANLPRDTSSSTNSSKTQPVLIGMAHFLQDDADSSVSYAYCDKMKSWFWTFGQRTTWVDCAYDSVPGGPMKGTKPQETHQRFIKELGDYCPTFPHAAENCIICTIFVANTDEIQDALVISEEEWSNRIFDTIKHHKSTYVFDQLIKLNPRHAETIRDERGWNIVQTICFEGLSYFLDVVQVYCDFPMLLQAITPYAGHSDYSKSNASQIAEKQMHTNILRQLDKCSQYEKELTPLMKAIRKQDSRLVHEIASGHPNIDEKKELVKHRQQSALYNAVTVGNRTIIGILLKAGANPSNAHSHSSLLTVAARSGHNHLLQFLVESCGQDVNCAATWESVIYRTPVEAAACVGHLREVQTLIGLGAFVTQGLFPCAAASGNIDLLRFISKRYSSISHTGSVTHNNTDALQCACISGDVTAIQCLIQEYHMDPDSEYNSNFSARTPMEIAAQKGHVNVVKCLLNHGAHVTDSVLPNAATDGHITVIKHILETTSSEVDIDGKDHYCHTALQRACENGHLTTAEYLLSRGASVDITTEGGGTCLHLSVEGGNAELIETILRLCPQSVNKRKHNYPGDLLFLVRGKDRGKPAWHYVQLKRELVPKFQKMTKRGNLDVADYGKVLCSGWGKNPPDDKKKKIKDDYESPIPNTEDQTPLHLALTQKSPSPKIVKIFLENGAGMNEKDYYELTPLDLAASVGNLEIVDLLLNHGALVTEKSFNIALDNDVDGDHSEVVKRLTNAFFQ